MRRADRLLQIVQAFRRHKGPLTAKALAAELEVSSRTIYRDILDLQSALVPIEGEAGVGYVLRPGYDLPPLMFSVEELEAIVLGARLAGDRGDPALARAAADVIAKVAAVVPKPLALQIERSALLVPARRRRPDERHLSMLRKAVRDRERLSISYTDNSGATTTRIVWPLALLFFAEVVLLGAWCERRGDFRFFRTDRISDPGLLGDRFDARNGALLQELMSSECPPA